MFGCHGGREFRHQYQFSSPFRSTMDGGLSISASRRWACCFIQVTPLALSGPPETSRDRRLTRVGAVELIDQRLREKGEQLHQSDAGVRRIAIRPPSKWLGISPPASLSSWSKVRSPKLDAGNDTVGPAFGVAAYRTDPSQPRILDAALAHPSARQHRLDK